MRKTKIICTIGPVSEKEAPMRKLIENGIPGDKIAMIE